MKGISQSIWKQTSTGEWKLFFNTNIPEIPQTEKQNLTPLLRHYYSSLQTSSLSTIKLGTLVMTPKGIGRIIKQDTEKATVKMSAEETDEIFAVDQISQNFYVYIKLYEKHLSNWYKIYFPVNGNIEMVKKVLENFKICDFTSITYLMISEGIEVKDQNTFEQLNMKNGTKIVLSGLKLCQYTIHRYNSTNTWWYTYLNDGITFSVSKSIKLIGVGLYGSQEGKTQTGKIKLFEGEMGGSLLLEENASVPPGMDESNCITPIMFSKPVKIKAGTDYMVEFQTSDYTYLYYGREGNKIVEGEKSVEFNFKFSNGTSHGTNEENGNFPEFYYYV